MSRASLTGLSITVKFGLTGLGLTGPRYQSLGVFFYYIQLGLSGLNFLSLYCIFSNGIKWSPIGQFIHLHVPHLLQLFIASKNNRFVTSQTINNARHAYRSLSSLCLKCELQKFQFQTLSCGVSFQTKVYISEKEVSVSVPGFKFSTERIYLQNHVFCCNF